MKINIVPIGNSKGIRIPKTILDQCQIKRAIDLSVEGDQIILKPVKKKPREGWAKAFKDMHAQGDDRLLIDDNVGLDWEDWEW